jgi:uncharacterized protein
MTLEVLKISPEMELWREAARDGKLLLRACRTCTKVHYYPRPICPFCFSDETEWLEAKGVGEIYSYSINRQGEPYVIAYVALDEGPIMMTNIQDVDPADVAIGQRVGLVFRPDASGVPSPMFRPLG